MGMHEIKSVVKGEAIRYGYTHLVSLVFNGALVVLLCILLAVISCDSRSFRIAAADAVSTGEADAERIEVLETSLADKSLTIEWQVSEISKQVKLLGECSEELRVSAITSDVLKDTLIKYESLIRERGSDIARLKEGLELCRGLRLGERELDTHPGTVEKPDTGADNANHLEESKGWRGWFRD